MRGSGASAILARAFSPAALLNATAPRRGIRCETGIVFEAAHGLALDVYAPEEADGLAPVVLFFYGGGWEEGDRAAYRFAGAALASLGMVTVIPDYRVYPEVRFPAFMQDAASAARWTIDRAGLFGGDRRHLFLMGHSAGAQIASLLALDPRYLAAKGLSPAQLAGVIGLSGPYDFLPLTSPVLCDIFGPEEERWQSQPINFVTHAAPPMLLATGTADRTVDPANTRRLAARLQENGVAVRTRFYRGIGHKGVMGALAAPLSILAPARRDITRFIAGYCAYANPGTRQSAARSVAWSR